MIQNENILKIENISAGYGTNRILNNINTTIEKGEILGIIGQNGSGKSTLLKCIFSLLKPQCGEIYFNNSLTSNLRPDELQKRGIAYFIQEGLIFPSLTVAEHLKVVYSKNKETELAFSYFPELKKYLQTRAGNLSGGQRQMLSFFMLLIQDATLWLLDEPTAGLSNANVKLILEFLQMIKEQNNKTILIVEHNFDFIFQVIDKAIILKNGTSTQKFSQNDFTKEEFLDKYLYS